MIKYISILLFLSTSVFAEVKNLSLLSTEILRYDYTASTTGLNSSKISYTLPDVNYTFMNKNYIGLVSFKYSQNQNIGNSTLGSTNIALEQKGWKYEVGLGYKYHLRDNLFVGPGLLYSDTYTTLDQIIGTKRIRTKKHDSDLRLYGLIGYYPTSSTIIYGAIELDNDLLSNEYHRDYSQYNASIIIYQFLSKEYFFFLKYEQALRDKKPTNTVTGNKEYIGYGFGFGMRM